jgi:hypothetical protein
LYRYCTCIQRHLAVLEPPFMLCTVLTVTVAVIVTSAQTLDAQRAQVQSRFPLFFNFMTEIGGTLTHTIYSYTRMTIHTHN